ncbi:pre-mRNA-splicing factor CWC25 homolog isoform X2 [Mycetomoellerius zeteki]|uniref:pre-mRNA-splicing factor CWC25 homolog isoform X2 n=1 Tax=Mycetomoellerius zeteki TaxID=64791 RepID=UPI00084E45E5|nr:PREDICTED: pre-mRNA-splicing factor CWC25 homolog isoform X2 [Trachymyrmex zeteki]
MGGGDLNLKKSWHPSTMKNIEKVRKAEQQNDQENKRIAELKREIEMEKDLEDIKKYAVEQGVIEKKDDKKLDWMYKGPNQTINREEYLLGRPVDKAFEQMQQAEKDSEMNRMPKNHVEYECIPPSLRFFSGNEQVDLARKIQEDPLYSIKKKEMETRNQLLKNPVKLKQLKELLEQQSSKNKSEKKKKKLKQSDSSEDEAKLDILLATKYKQLKDNISEKDLLKSMKKIKHKRTKKSKKHRNSDSETDSSNDDTSVKKRRHKRRKQKKNRSDSDDSTDSNSKNITKRETENKTEYDRKYSRNDTKLDDIKKQDRKRKLSEDRNLKYKRSQKYGEEDNKNNKRQRYDNKQRDDSRNKYNDKRRYSVEKETTISNSGKTSAVKSTSNTDHIKFKDRKEEKYRPKTRPSLTEEEKEQRRKEMMANAVWRDKEREKNVKMYREQEKKEDQNITSNNKDFIRKQLVVATEVGTVASRIKANINNIQRSGRAMDTNFAKR